MSDRTPTPDQLAYVRILMDKWHIAPAVFGAYLAERYGSHPAFMTRVDVSALIDEMKAWRAVPPAILELAGQTSLGI